MFPPPPPISGEFPGLLPVAWHRLCAPVAHLPALLPPSTFNWCICICRLIGVFVICIYSLILTALLAPSTVNFDVFVFLFGVFVFVFGVFEFVDSSELHCSPLPLSTSVYLNLSVFLSQSFSGPKTVFVFVILFISSE